jgi:predicted translin family RNA/ssDNA-binding protein
MKKLNTDELKEKLLNGKIDIDSLSDEEVAIMNNEMKNELDFQHERLSNINKKIKEIKIKIDNWNNN